MNRDEEFLKAVSERKAPMALIPEDVVDAVAKRCQLALKDERIIKIVVWASILMWLVGLVIVVMLLKNITSDVILVIAITAFGLPVLIVSAGLIWCLYHDPKDIDHQQLPNTGCSLSAFADRFMPLMDAFGDDGKRMGDYTLRAIGIHAKAILYEYAQKARLAQANNPDNPLAGLDAKQKFRCLHETFTMSGLNPGPHGPYFKWNAMRGRNIPCMSEETVSH